MSEQVRYVCPKNGQPAVCLVCHEACPHRCETLALDGHPPICPTHRIPMVKP